MDSLINQTHKNIEIVIINDGSTDNTKQIIQDYMSKDSRIIYIENKENMQLYETLCIAYENVTGDYITVCDADDFLHIEACTILLAKAIETNADMVTSNWLCQDTEKFNNTIHFPATEIKGKDVLQTWMNHEYRSSKSGSLISKSIIDKFLEITPRNLALSHAEDALMFLQIHFLVQHKIHIDIATYAYRKNINSTSSTKFISSCITRVHDYGVMILYTKLFLEENNIYDQYQKEYISTYNWHLYDSLACLYNISNTEKVVNVLQKLPSNIQKVYLEFLLKKVYEDDLISVSVIMRNKWYDFGLMTRNQKIKHLIKYILRKLGLKFI